MDRRSFISILIAFFVNAFLFGCTRNRPTISYSSSVPGLDKPFPDAPKAIVVYDSWSGNTENIARIMSTTLECEAVHIDNLSDDDVGTYDLIVVGSPVHGGMPTDKIDAFLSNHKSSATAVFVTYGAPLLGSFTATACLNKMEKKLQPTCVGKFKCLGFHQIFRTYSSHPDEADKAEAARFASGLLEKCRHTVSFS